MKNFFLHMEQSYGWNKSTHGECIFWFKGYLFDMSFDDVVQPVSVFISNISKYKEDLSNFLSNIRGHYSFVIYMGDVLIAVVDKVCTIPLFYAETDNQILIGNSATVIKDSICSSGCSFNDSSVLEISMSGYTIGDKTLYNSIHQITAGEYMCIHNSRIHKQYYHTYSPWKTRTRTESLLKKELTSVLIDVMDRLALSVKNKRVVVPLSAGYDSRLIVSGLKQAGVKDVLCVSYGRAKSFEVSAAKNIASKLGYDFKHVNYDSSYIRNYYNSDEYSKFKSCFDRKNSVEFVQDMSAISFMHANSELDKNSVIINGMTGDYISGSHILHVFSPYVAHNRNMSRDNNANLFDMAMMEYVQKHYNLWDTLSNNNNNNKIIDNILIFLEDRVPGFNNFDNMYAIFEFLEFYGRQSKFVLKGQEVYDYYGYDWRLPLWDSVFIDFWQSVPLDYKYSQKLYKDVLVENNWGNVWNNIPLNKKTINPLWIRPVRFLSKILFSPLEKKQWHQFERNVLEYWMDDSYGSKRYPYSRFLLDKKGHRNILSFRTEDYIKKHVDLSLDYLA